MATAKRTATELLTMRASVPKPQLCIDGWGTYWNDDTLGHRVALLAKTRKALEDQWKLLYPKGPKFDPKLARRLVIFEAANVTESLLRAPSKHAPPGCHCVDRCSAPVVMGQQTPCRDPDKRATFIASAARKAIAKAKP